MAGLSDVIVSNGLLSFVGKVAPLLGTALGSPIGGIALSLIANAFGVKNSDAGEILNALQSAPDAAMRLKQLEMDHQEALLKISSQDFQTEVADKQDARKYAENYKGFLMLMAIMVTSGFFLCLFLIFSEGININDSEKQLLTLLIGMLASKWQTIIDFFYGASRYQGGIK